MPCQDLSHLKKYKKRPSPARSAQACIGKTMRGNDGKMWTSKKDLNGIARWKRLQRSHSKVKQIGKIFKPTGGDGVAQVRAQLPKKVNEKFATAATSLKVAQNFYGQHARKLTLNLAKVLKGQTVVALQGQAWNMETSLQGRTKTLESLSVGAIIGKKQNLSVRLNKNSFELYLYGGAYVSGSGADPVFVFVK